MPLPDGVPRVTVTSGEPMVGPGGTPARGQLLFVGPPLVTVPALQLTLNGYAERAVFDSAGMASIDLIPGDLAGMSPGGGWTYEVRSDFQDGSPNWVRFIRLTNAMAGTTVRLDQVLVPDPDPGTYVVVTGPRGLQGVAGQDGAAGASAYQVAVAAGFSGTISQWLASLVGPKGDPGSGGGGGVTPVWYDTDLGVGIVTLHPQSDWTPMVDSGGHAVRRIVADVSPGDKLKLSAAFLRIGTSAQLDARFVVNGSPGRHISSLDDGSGIPGPEGYAPWYNQLSFKEASGTRTLTAHAPDISSDGTVTLEMVYQGAAIPDDGSHKAYWGNGYLGLFDVEHWKVGA